MEQHEIQSYKKAGTIASQIKQYVREIVKKDMLLIEIANKIDEKIKELGGKPAFPVNLSVNEIAAHYTPGLNDDKKAEGLLKIDIGVEVEGYIADTAFSLDLTEDKKHEEMIKTNETILQETLQELTTGSKISDIGKLIQEKLAGRYAIVKNLSGHQLDKNIIHAGVNIPNYENNNETPIKDKALAIEPFLTTGQGEVYEGPKSEIYRLERHGPIRDKDARRLLVYIKEKYNTKPFCKRWLEKHGFDKLDFSLNQLVKAGILHNYSVLIEKSKQPVSQAEQTIIITDKVEVTTR
ncbi:MAG: type II methionyl aminopeptidase [Candidatus Nanoarchaeia archaeon]